MRNNIYKILISVKALDEGLNVPDANIGIIFSGNSTSRQVIQRFGRLLRVKDNINSAILYQLYFKNTIEAKYIMKRMQHVEGYTSVEWI